MIKRFQNLSAATLSGPRLKKNITTIKTLSKDEKFYQVKLTSLKAEKQQDLEAVDAYEKKNKKMKRKLTIVDYLDRQEQAQKNNKIKSMIDIDEKHTNSIKSLAIEKKSSVTLTTSFMKGKMLMFAKC